MPALVTWSSKSQSCIHFARGPRSFSGLAYNSSSFCTKLLTTAKQRAEPGTVAIAAACSGVNWIVGLVPEAKYSCNRVLLSKYLVVADWPGFNSWSCV